MANDTVSVSNVTFAPSCINNWHTHSGSCQVLVGVSGRGYYQIWGQDPVEMKAGESVTIPEGLNTGMALPATAGSSICRL